MNFFFFFFICVCNFANIRSMFILEVLDNICTILYNFVLYQGEGKREREREIYFAFVYFYMYFYSICFCSF